MNRRYLAVSSCIAVFVFSTPCRAQGKAALAKQTAKFVFQKFGKEVEKETVASLAGRIEAFVGKYGDKAIEAIRRVGPRSFQLVETAEEHQSIVLKLLADLGEDAIWIVTRKSRIVLFMKYGENACAAMIKHNEIADPLLEDFGILAADALAGISSRNARRLAMMNKDGVLKKIARINELLILIHRYGDRAVNFIYESRDCLLQPTACDKFLADPETFLNGKVVFAEANEEIINRTVEKETIQPATPSRQWLWIGIVPILPAIVIFRRRINLRG